MQKVLIPGVIFKLITQIEETSVTPILQYCLIGSFFKYDSINVGNVKCLKVYTNNESKQNKFKSTNFNYFQYGGQSAVSMGLVDIALGSDTFGSVRVPAHN